MGMMVSSLLRMSRSMGLWPNFDTMDENKASAMLTTGSEVMRMLRDGDPDSTDDSARTIYGKLTATGD
jgi:hypothetical protein